MEADFDPTTRRAFAHFDKDASGGIDYSELRPALAQLGLDATTTEAAALLSKYDADASGRLELTEFARSVAAPRAAP
jgi:Ca2+-binding EF-hand superfamily protein